MKFLLPMALFAFSTSATPGPNNIMIMTSGLNYGIKRSLPHFWGICLGFPLMVIAVGVGLGSIFTMVPQIHDVIKYLGAMYLLYLTYLTATAPVKEPGDASVPEGAPLSFKQAALFQWMNPKAWIMAVGAISAYTVATENMLIQILLISLAFLLACLPCIGAWLFFGAGLRRFLQQPVYRRYFNYTMAALLLASIVLIFIE